MRGQFIFALSIQFLFVSLKDKWLAIEICTEESIQLNNHFLKILQGLVFFFCSEIMSLLDEYNKI